MFSSPPKASDSAPTSWGPTPKPTMFIANSAIADITARMRGFTSDCGTAWPIAE